jgi:radical SAM superfamily enzyme YgiQ (UPF0313 family)
MQQSVILIYPKTGIEFRLNMPFSVLFVAAPLIAKGYVVQILDQRVFSKKEFFQRLNDLIRGDVICVGISSMTGPQIKYGLEIARMIRKINPKLLIVWGGIHPTILPENTLKHDLVDIVCRGEGEETFLELIENFSKDQSIQLVRGISYKDSSREIFHNEDREFIDLTKLPPLPYELLPIHKYIHSSELGERVLAMYTSKGCPHKCSYCYNEVFNKRKWRSIPIESVIKDITFFKSKFNVDSFDLLDDNFFVNKDRVLEFCRELKRKNLKIKWFADCRIDDIKKCDSYFLKIIRDSGLEQIFIGAESGCNRILEFIKKGHKAEDIIEINTLLKHFDIQPVYSFMIGFPNETIAEIFQTIDVVDKLIKENKKAIIAGLNCWNPYPGTELYKSFVSDIVVPKSLDKWSHSASWYKAWGRDNKNIIENISFISNFLTIKKTRIPEVLLKIYLPVARFRWRKRFFRSFLDTKIFDIYKSGR